MKAIILLICRSRFHVPRVGGFIHSAQFAAFTHPYQPFVFEGRTLDMEEFNVAASRLLDVRNANLGYEVSVRMVPDDLTADETSDETSGEEPNEQFTLDGKNILLNGVRVAGLFGEGKQLRVLSDHSHLRQAIEEWLETPNTNEQ